MSLKIRTRKNFKYGYFTGSVNYTHEEVASALKTIEKYQTNTSILRIRNSFHDRNKFPFQIFYSFNLEQNIKNLENEKATQRCDLLVKIA